MSHPLDGPRIKIAFAKEQIGSLEFYSHRFFNRELGAAPIGQLNKQTGLYHLAVPVESPPEWAVVVGEIVHNLRSALDQLFCQLAIVSRSGRTFRYCEDERTGFPLFVRGPRARRRRGSIDDRFNRSRLVPHLKRRFITAIERAQPYHRRNGGRMSPLWLLHEMSNTDKHRLIIVASRWVAGTTTRYTNGGTFSGQFTIEAGMSVKPHTAVTSANAEKVDVDTYHAYQIAFGDACSAVENLPVTYTLARIADAVDGIVESFAKDFA